MKARLIIPLILLAFFLSTCSKAEIPLYFDVSEWQPESGQIVLGESIVVHYLTTDEIPEGVLAEARIYPQTFTLDTYEFEVIEGELLNPELGIESWIAFQKQDGTQSLKLAIRPTCLGEHKIALSIHAFEVPAGPFTYARLNNYIDHAYTVVE